MQIINLNGIMKKVGNSKFGDHGVWSQRKFLAMVSETANSETMVFAMLLEPANSGTMVFAMVLEPANSETLYLRWF